MAIPHTRNGNVFELPGGAMLVEEACSGVQSLFSLLFCAFLLIAWLRRSAFLAPLYALAAIASALVMNILRVAAIGIGQERLGVDLAHGWKHEVLGYLCLGLGILLLASTDRLLLVLFYPVLDARKGRKSNPLSWLWNSFFTSSETVEALANHSISRSAGYGGRSITWALTGVAVLITTLLWVPQVGYLIAKPRESWETGKQIFWDPGVNPFGKETAHLQIDNHQISRNGADPILGENADVWDVKFAGLDLRIAVSQPYPEFHNLLGCYEGGGWEQTAQSKKLSPESSEWPLVDASFIKPPRKFGFLVYSGLGKDGSPVGPLEMKVSSLVREWFEWRRSDPYRNNQGCLMIQMFVASEEPLSEKQKLDVVELHCQVRELLRTQYKASFGR